VARRWSHFFIDSAGMSVSPIGDDDMIIDFALPLLLLPGPVVAMPAPPAATAPAPVPVVTRVRPLSGPARAVLDDAIARSPTIVRLIAELQRHDVIVYVDVEAMTGARGATSLVSANDFARYVRVLVDIRLDPRQQIEVLGHELQHAMEIARDAGVVDIRSFQALFGRIGYPTGRASYETDAARKIEYDVRAEISKIDPPDAPTLS
jgi:hypothetical protein